MSTLAAEPRRDTGVRHLILVDVDAPEELQPHEVTYYLGDPVKVLTSETDARQNPGLNTGYHGHAFEAGAIVHILAINVPVPDPFYPRDLPLADGVRESEVIDHIDASDGTETWSLTVGEFRHLTAEEERERFVANL